MPPAVDSCDGREPKPSTPYFFRRETQMIKNFLRDETGMETVEWAVVAALLVLGLVVIFGALGQSASSKLNSLDSAIK